MMVTKRVCKFGASDKSIIGFQDILMFTPFTSNRKRFTKAGRKRPKRFWYFAHSTTGRERFNRFWYYVPSAKCRERFKRLFILDIWV